MVLTKEETAKLQSHLEAVNAYIQANIVPHLHGTVAIAGHLHVSESKVYYIEDSGKRFTLLPEDGERLNCVGVSSTGLDVLHNQIAASTQSGRLLQKKEHNYVI